MPSIANIGSLTEQQIVTVGHYLMKVIFYYGSVSIHYSKIQNPDCRSCPADLYHLHDLKPANQSKMTKFIVVAKRNMIGNVTKLCCYAYYEVIFGQISNRWLVISSFLLNEMMNLQLDFHKYFFTNLTSSEFQNG